MHDQWLLYVQDQVVEGLGSFLSGCLMQLAKYTIHNHALSLQLVCNQGNHSVVKTTNLFLLCTGLPCSLVECGHVKSMLSL